MQYLIRFAKEQGFDPHAAENWYSPAAARIVEKVYRLLFLFKLNVNISLQRASGCIAFYKGNFVQALLDLFPQIGLEKSKLLDIQSRINFHKCVMITNLKNNIRTLLERLC